LFKTAHKRNVINEVCIFVSNDFVPLNLAVKKSFSLFVALSVRTYQQSFDQRGTVTVSQIWYIIRISKY